MRLTKLIFILLFLIGNLGVKGQIGTRFWFAAPDVSLEHYNNSIPLNLHITAIYNTHVTISRPADPSFTPIEFDLGPQQTQQVRLDDYLGVDEIEVYSRALGAGNFKQNKGFMVEADPGEITAYYELEGRNNTDIIALKSHNAMGRDFWVSTQRKYKNHGYSDDFSGFVVVATKDDTNIDIDPNGNNLEHHGTTPFTVTNLDAGQAFAVRAHGQAPLEHIFGIHVTSNHDITIIIFDDSMQIDDGSGNWDIFADQIVPTDLVGMEYIVLKGEVQDQVANTKDGEAIFITPTEPGTNVWIDGAPVHSFTNPGEYFEYVIKNLSTHVRADKPIYVNHITGYSTDPAGARELGGAILPPIDNCTGSHSVTVKRTPATGFVFFNNLMVRNDTVTGSPTRNQAIYNFTYSIDGGPPVAINPNHFTYIMDSAFAVYDRNKAGGGAYYNSVVDNQILRVENPIARFHLGVMQGKQSPGCKYGYFSDYAASDASAGIGGFTNGPSGFFCNLNPIQIVASGGTSYKWYAPYEPSLIDQLDYDTVSSPYFFPDTTGAFYFNVVIGGECNSKDTLETEILVSEEASTSFTFSADEGCSPFAPVLTNNSDTVIGVTQIWTIYPATGSAYQINQDTIPRTFSLSLPENHTDTIQTHNVKLIVKGLYNSCPTQRSKDIKILPQVDAGFDQDDTLGCHPLLVNFTNTSTGHVDSTSYTWDFGDNSQSFDIDPTHNFTNYGFIDSLYTVEMVAESPFGCTDTAIKQIKVHPRIRSAMAINTSASCSPLDITIDPANSVGVDTFYWHVTSPTADTMYSTTVKAPVTLYHQDLTYTSPDTIRVNLVGINKMGCTDTFPQRNIVVYPEVTAEFEIVNDSICDANSIQFVNTSQGFDLFYNWDFDDGTVFQDTLGNDYNHIFYNRSDKDSAYRVSLKATSAFFCENTFDTLVVVHPYIKANFGLDYENNCTPILTTISNLSIRGHSFEWDFGDGTNSTTTDTLFTHQYWNNSADDDTTYTIQLVAANNEGCSDTLIRSLDIFPHVVADFKISDSIGCSPLSVGFTNESTGGLLSYLWDFGNGTSSTNSSPLPRMYTNYNDYDTSYVISLTAVNPNGCDSTITDTVDVYAFIDADFNLPRADSCSPFELRPENLSSPGAHIYEWDLINSGLPTDNDFVPDFGPQTNTGLLTDTLYLRLIAYGASDPEHYACADRDSIRILVYPELDVDFSLDVHESCQPLISGITNNTNIPTGTVFQWFVDTTFYSALQNPPALNLSNLEDVDEEHIITLNGESKFGCSGMHLDTVTVYSLVDARFNVNKSGICSGDQFEIDRSTSRGGIVGYEWDFAGVNDNRTDEVFTYSFENTSSATPLVKPIRLTVRNSHNCTSSIKKNINVYPEVRAAFALDDSTVCYPHATTFTNSSENASKYFWDFGDGTGSNAATPLSHQFANFDNVNDEDYSIWMIARSDYNCYDSIQHGITIYAQPDAEFYFPVSVDCPPFEASMVNESVGYNLDYLWDFGDGSTSTLEHPNHEFTNTTSSIHDVPIRLTVTSGRGCVDSVSRELSVYPDVYVDFSRSVTQGCSPLNVSFNGSASNDNTLLWFIDGQAFSTLEDPTYRFVNNTPETREYDVTFRASSLYGCTDDTTKTITVFSSPSAEFIPDPYLQEYDYTQDSTQVEFSNETFFRDNWEYLWDFGDGNTDDTKAALFDYYYGDHFWGPIDDDSRITITMMAWNTENEACRDTSTHDIYIKPPVPQIALDEDIAGCEPFTVDFAATTKYVYDDFFEWDFGVDGATSDAAEPSYTFTEPGVYTVKLIVRGDGGTNWDSRLITVHPKPDVNFTFNDSILFIRSQNHPDELVSFYNYTEHGQDYYWGFNLPTNDYNDIPFYMDTARVAFDSVNKNTTWFYDKPGDYYVFLKTTSEYGCEDALIHPVPIHVLGEGDLQFPTGFFVDPSAPRDEQVSDPENPSRQIFRAYGHGVEEFKLEIYNRWGVLVFESDNINKGWNGFIHGKPAKQDVYVWRARGRFTNGEPFDMSGDVTLIIAPDNGEMY
jgi:PKD repeat protein